MNQMLRRLNINRRLALVLWGTVLLAFLVTGAGLAVFQRLTLEHRARQLLLPYVELVAVGTDTAVAFEDPVRATELLDTLRANPHLLEAELFLEDGRRLAHFSREPAAGARPPPAGTREITIHQDTVELVHELSRGARLRLTSDLAPLEERTREAQAMFGAGVVVLLLATLGQLTVLRRTIVQPIASLTATAELVRARVDSKHRVPITGTDEVARLGQGFNTMLEALQARELELRQVTDFQRAILEGAAHGIISTSPDGVVTSFNPAAEQLLGYASSEVLGQRSPTSWHDPEELARRARWLSEELGEPITPDFAVFQARLRHGLPEEHEWTFLRKDGTRVPVLLSVTALRDEGGTITGFIGLSSDLTRRKQDEDRLRRLNRELHAISECGQVLARAEDEPSLVAAICRVVCEDADYRMAWVGYAEHDEAKTIRPVAWAGAEEGYLEEVRASWADGAPGHSPVGLAIRSGQTSCLQDFEREPAASTWKEAATRRGYRSSLALPLKADGDSFGALNIYSTEPNAFTPDEVRLLEELSGDLSFGIIALRTRLDRERARQEVVELNRRLEERVADRTAQLELANQELESFSYSVSHDLRAPLRHIDGFLDLLKRRTATSLDEPSRHYMATISEAARRMSALIDDLLSFSRMGRSEMAAGDVDLAALASEIIKELSPETAERTVQWRVGALPVVRGDRAMLRVVLVNLIANALKFTRPRAEAVIDIGCQPGGDPATKDTEAVVFVRDNGVGFDMAYADKLFGVFQRLHRVDEFEGTGIGLANVRRVIKRHGGRTWAEGTVDGGATFFFSLPRRGPS